MPLPTPLLGVSVCLLRGTDVLLVERGRAPFKGRLSLPGGRVEFGETLDRAARREVLEETGLTLDEVEFLKLHEAIGEDVHAVIAVHRSVLAQDAAPFAGDDAAAVFFVDVAAVAGLEAQGRTTPGLAAIVLAAAMMG